MLLDVSALGKRRSLRAKCRMAIIGRLCGGCAALLRAKCRMAIIGRLCGGCAALGKRGSLIGDAANESVSVAWGLR